MTGTNSSTEHARLELVSTLNAIEDKLNVPRKVSRAVSQGKVEAARLQRQNPAAFFSGVAAVAVVAGTAVWAITRAIVVR
ncbi:hypothetical protein D9V29_08830 [Mycetocola manganoxydans]|uniref:DUF3618 domain-containing protein n=1 Tax=Mycetocola manganoxydans TaxID=699879 RepID=A0A3L6ZUU4_9MICO|nr:hypothetical protein [Mycetocola manganoxydans]RLP71435.1 hypothetical protein D9V29_08830 [Mycetocola manganoxydans]GHD46491.1 hypothetical protein GCM10008097_16510 [Mycetocola manganoxydans]